MRSILTECPVFESLCQTNLTFALWSFTNPITNKIHVLIKLPLCLWESGLAREIPTFAFPHTEIKLVDKGTLPWSWFCIFYLFRRVGFALFKCFVIGCLTPVVLCYIMLSLLNLNIYIFLSWTCLLLRFMKK